MNIFKFKQTKAAYWSHQTLYILKWHVCAYRVRLGIQNAMTTHMKQYIYEESNGDLKFDLRPKDKSSQIILSF